MTDTLCVYATDEDVALRASADFSILCPKDQCLAYGYDGVFGNDRWTLSSSAVDFVAAGIAPGQVVRLTQPTSAFKPPGDALTVDSVGAIGITLRRKGMPTGGGQPPGPIDGVNGVEFTIATLIPQIVRAGFDINHRFGIDSRIAGRRPSDLFDPRELRDAAVLTVLYRQCIEISRGSPDRADTFAAKTLAYRQELDDLLARLVVHFATASGAATTQSTTRLSARLSR